MYPDRPLYNCQKKILKKRSLTEVSAPSIADMIQSLEDLGLDSSHVARANGEATPDGVDLLGYFQHRADVLNRETQHHFMTKAIAKEIYDGLLADSPSEAAVPKNKQAGDKSGTAYFTAIVNLLIRTNLEGRDCNFNPNELTTFTHNRQPFRTLARRLDGAYPSPVNPIAAWEIKEYYNTITFGSRVADGVYESLLDGMEIEEFRNLEKNMDVRHYLFVDDHFTWWTCGKSYLCRIVDMLHMGYVDEVLFGREVVGRLPQIVKEWLEVERDRKGEKPKKS